MLHLLYKKALTTIILILVKVPFPTVVYNVGSHYNNSNYTFIFKENIGFMHIWD